jgi:hypothetical protein
MLAEPDKILLSLVPRLNVFMACCLNHRTNLLLHGVICIRDCYIVVLLVYVYGFY